MRHELHALSMRVAIATAASCVTIVGGSCSALLLEQHNRAIEGREPLAAWLIVLLVVVALLVSAAVPWVVVSSTTPPVVRHLVTGMRQLSRRAEEFGEGGFSLDPSAAPEITPAPLDSGIHEIDTVARIMDRNARSVARALTAERTFASDASHQLRTPLAALLMRLEEIAESSDIAVARQEATIAISQTERLSGVVDDLLHRTRPGHADGGRSVSLDTVLSGIQKEWKPALDAEGRRFTLTMERAMIVRSSSSGISQILNTLIENSLVHGQGEVRVSAKRRGPSAVIEVWDDGPGIPMDMARRIFDRAVTTGSGTGLGLAVARDTAESFGGRLELVHNQPALFALYVSMAANR